MENLSLPFATGACAGFGAKTTAAAAVNKAPAANDNTVLIREFISAAPKFAWQSGPPTVTSPLFLLKMITGLQAVDQFPAAPE